MFNQPNSRPGDREQCARRKDSQKMPAVLHTLTRAVSDSCSTHCVAYQIRHRKRGDYRPHLSDIMSEQHPPHFVDLCPGIVALSPCQHISRWTRTPNTVHTSINAEIAKMSHGSHST